MAGWNPSVCIPQARCRFCRRVVAKRDFVRIEGVYPAHRICAENSGKSFTEGTDIKRSAC